MPNAVGSYKDLDIWKTSCALAVRAYGLAGQFPTYETYGLADQVRRAASSIPANIAEGSGRGTRREWVRSLRIARGSLAELHSHLTLAAAVGYCKGQDGAIFGDIDRVQRMLNALIGSLQRGGFGN